MLLHGLTATRRYVVMGSRAAGALRPSRDRLRRARPRPLRARARAGAYGYERLAARSATRCSTRWRSSGRCSRAPRWARTRPCASRSITPSAWRRSALITPAFDPDTRSTRRARSSRAGTRSRGDCAKAGWRGSCAPMTSTTVPEAWRATVETVASPAPRRPRAPGGGGRRARSRAALATVRAPRASWRAIARPDGRRRQPRRGRPGTSARGRRTLRAARSPARACVVEEPGPPLRSPLAWQGGRARRALLDSPSSPHRRVRIVITYTRMPGYANGTADSYDRISGSDGGSRPGRARPPASYAAMRRVLDAGCGSGRVTEALIAASAARARDRAWTSPSRWSTPRRERLGPDADVRVGPTCSSWSMARSPSTRSSRRPRSTGSPTTSACSRRLHARAAPRRATGRAVRGRGQHRRAARARPARCWNASPTPSTFATGRRRGTTPAPQTRAQRLLAAGFATRRVLAGSPRRSSPSTRASSSRRSCSVPHVQQLPEQLREPFMDEVLAELGRAGRRRLRAPEHRRDRVARPRPPERCSGQRRARAATRSSPTSAPLNSAA